MEVPADDVEAGRDGNGDSGGGGDSNSAHRRSFCNCRVPTAVWVLGALAVVIFGLMGVVTLVSMANDRKKEDAAVVVAAGPPPLS